MRTTPLLVLQINTECLLASLILLSTIFVIARYREKVFALNKYLYKHMYQHCVHIYRDGDFALWCTVS